MYEINLVKKALVRTENDFKAIRALKVLSLVFTIAVFAVLVMVAVMFIETQKVTENINDLKMKIDEQRRINKIKDVEKEWTNNYYKMLAIKDIINKNTKTGLLLRDVGLYAPEWDVICTFDFDKNETITETVRLKVLKDAFKPEEYVQKVKDAYSRSIYLSEGKNITISSKDEIKEMTVSGVKVNTFVVTIPLKEVAPAAPDGTSSEQNQGEGE